MCDEPPTNDCYYSEENHEIGQLRTLDTLSNVGWAPTWWSWKNGENDVTGGWSIFRRPSSSVSGLGLLPEAWSSTSQVLALNFAVSVSKWVHHHWTDDVKPLEFQMEAQDDYVLKGSCLSSPPFLRVPGQFWEGKSTVKHHCTRYHVFILEGYLERIQKQ